MIWNVKGKRTGMFAPPEFEPEFRAGYEKGRALYEYEAQITSLQKQLENIDIKINKKEKRLYADNLTEEQRRKIRAELKRLDIEYRDVSRELKYMENNPPTDQVYQIFLFIFESSLDHRLQRRQIELVDGIGQSDGNQSNR